MILRFLSRLVILSMLLLPAMSVDAQDYHFLYLQSDGNQPFYVRMNDQVYSSTAAGYMILSKLTDGTYPLVIGFPRNEFPEEQFHVVISGQDEGLLLNRKSGNLSLLNLKTGALLSGEPSVQSEAGVAAAPSPPKIVEDRQDAFSSMLSDVVRDSSVREQAADKRVIADTQLVSTPDERFKSKTAELIPVPDAAGTGVVESSNPNTANRDPMTGPGRIDQLLNQSDSKGQELVYMDRNTQDTVRVFIPGNRADTDFPAKAVIPAEPVLKEERADTAEIAVNDQTETRHEPAITPEPPSRPAEITPDVAEEPLRRASNSNCAVAATRRDFLKLRKKMAGEFDSDKMIGTALRSFKTMCYTTEQVRDLAYLFLDDEGKYRFFDAAYPYVSDSDKFSTLASTLKDSYYIGRFKAMIR